MSTVLTEILGMGGGALYLQLQETQADTYFIQDNCNASLFLK